MLAASGNVPPLASIVLAYQIGYLSNFVPVPGGIGVLDAGLIGMLVLYGVNATDVSAASIVYHAIALWIPGLGGLYATPSVAHGRVFVGSTNGRVYAFSVSGNELWTL